MIPVAFKSRQAMRGPMFAGIALVGVTALAATTQQFVHDVTFDTDGQTFVEGAVPFAIFAGLPVLGLLIVIGLGLLTAKNGVANGRPKITSAFVFGLLGADLVAGGVVANAVLGIADLELLGTSFEEGATLFVVYGSAIAVIGGLAFWAPKLWGRVLPDKQLMPLGLLGVVGAALAALPLCIAGFLDQAGGVPANDADVARMLSLDYDSTGSLWNTLSLVGHGLMALTVLAVVGLMLKTFTGEGDEADDNPFGGHTVEWSTSSPAPADNYEHVPTVASPEPQFDMTYEGSLS
jgi:heme/copper-type cytochrome/quinol oxidase subunit 1